MTTPQYLVTPVPGEPAQSRIDVEQQILAVWPKSILQAMMACRQFGLPKNVVYDMVPGVCRHYILDHLTRCGSVVGDTADVDPQDHANPDRMSQFLQKLGVLIATGQAMPVQEGDGYMSSQIPVMPHALPGVPPNNFMQQGPAVPPSFPNFPTQQAPVPSAPTPPPPPLANLQPPVGLPSPGNMAPPLPAPGMEQEKGKPGRKPKNPPKEPELTPPAPVTPVQVTSNLPPIPAPPMPAPSPQANAQFSPPPPAPFPLTPVPAAPVPTQAQPLDSGEILKALAALSAQAEETNRLLKELTRSSKVSDVAQAIDLYYKLMFLPDNVGQYYRQTFSDGRMPQNLEVLLAMLGVSFSQQG